MFEGAGILESFCERIVLPNMSLRTFEEEMFEDDPFEYVRRDLLETAGGGAQRSHILKAWLNHNLQRMRHGVNLLRTSLER